MSKVFAYAWSFFPGFIGSSLVGLFAFGPGKEHPQNYILWSFGLILCAFSVFWFVKEHNGPKIYFVGQLGSIRGVSATGAKIFCDSKEDIDRISLIAMREGLWQAAEALELSRPEVHHTSIWLALDTCEIVLLRWDPEWIPGQGDAPKIAGWHDNGRIYIYMQDKDLLKTAFIHELNHLIDFRCAPEMHADGAAHSSRFISQVNIANKAAKESAVVLPYLFPKPTGA